MNSSILMYPILYFIWIISLISLISVLMNKPVTYKYLEDDE